VRDFIAWLRERLRHSQSPPSGAWHCRSGRSARRVASLALGHASKGSKSRLARKVANMFTAIGFETQPTPPAVQ
jgi:hypothetical protein